MSETAVAAHVRAAKKLSNKLVNERERWSYLKWGEKVINYIMRQANEIYYGSQAQNLSFMFI